MRRNANNRATGMLKYYVYPLRRRGFIAKPLLTTGNYHIIPNTRVTRILAAAMSIEQHAAQPALRAAHCR